MKVGVSVDLDAPLFRIVRRGQKNREKRVAIPLLTFIVQMMRGRSRRRWNLVRKGDLLSLFVRISAEVFPLFRIFCNFVFYIMKFRWK